MSGKKAHFPEVGFFCGLNEIPVMSILKVDSDDCDQIPQMDNHTNIA